jgi:hypothetical protein
MTLLLEGVLLVIVFHKDLALNEAWGCFRREGRGGRREGKEARRRDKEGGDRPPPVRYCS